MSALGSSLILYGFPASSKVPKHSIRKTEFHLKTRKHVFNLKPSENSQKLTFIIFFITNQYYFYEL